MLYDYKCPKCNELKENVNHGAYETPEIKCKKCDIMMKKQFSCSFNIIVSHKSSSGLSTSKTDLLRHQAKILNESQGGL